MTLKQMLKLKADAKAKHDKAVRSAQLTYSDEIEAIDRVWTLLNEKGAQQPRQVESQQAEAVATEPAQAPEHSGPALSLVSLVEAALPTKVGYFTTAVMVEKKIRAAHPEINGSLSRKAIFKVLKHFADEKRLRIHQYGEGRRPTSFVLNPEFDKEVVAK